MDYKVTTILSVDDRSTLSIGRAPRLTDLPTLRKSGVSVLVCLMTWNELKYAKLEGLGRAWMKMEGIFYHFPVSDGGVASIEELDCLAQTICQYLHQGLSVHVHCRVGKNRSAMVIGLCQLLYGEDLNYVIKELRKRRQGCLKNKQQLQILSLYYQLCREK